MPPGIRCALVWLAACGTLLHSLVEGPNPKAEAIAHELPGGLNVAGGPQLRHCVVRLRRDPSIASAGIAARRAGPIPARKRRVRNSPISTSAAAIGSPFCFLLASFVSAASWRILAPVNDMRGS